MPESAQERWARRVGEQTERVELLRISCIDSAAMESSLEMLFGAYAAIPVEVHEPSVGERTWIYDAPHGVAIVATKGASIARVYVSSRSLDAGGRRALAEDLARRALPPE